MPKETKAARKNPLREEIGVRELARRLKVSAPAVSKAIADGRIRKAVVRRTPKGWPKLDPVVARKEWIKNTDPSAQRANRSGPTGKQAKGRRRRRAKPTPTPTAAAACGDLPGQGRLFEDGDQAVAPDEPSPDGDEVLPPRSDQVTDALRRVRMLEGATKTQRMQMELHERAGRLVGTALVRAEAYAAYRPARDHILNLPRQLAKSLAVETDPAVIEAELDREFRRMLDKICAMLLEEV